MREFFSLVSLAVASNVIGYSFGWGSGDQRGYARATAEQAVRKSEHDLVMQKIGVCKWAKIMAEDTRCKTELP
jgi:hypothetical protein